MITARSLMTQDPITLPVNAKVREAARILRTLDIRHLPIVDADGALVGMLSDRDLRNLDVPLMDGGEYLGNVRMALDASVSSLMSSDVLSVSPESDVAEIVELMLEYKVGAVPVIDPDGLLVGIVSYMDILRELPLDGAAS